MPVSDSQVKSKARELGSQKRPSSELDAWLSSNQATVSQGTLAGQEYNAALNAGNSSNQTQSQSPLGKLDNLNEAGKGKSYVGEMNPSNRVDTSNVLSGAGIFDEIVKQLKLESDLHTEINERMGITGDLSRAYRDTLIETLPAATQLGFDINNITEMVTSLSEKSGRFNLFSKDTLDRTFVTARAFGLSLSQMADAMGKFEEVGLGSADTLERIETAGRHSLSLGLNSRKLVGELKDNIGKLNEFGFANGVEGLNRMAQKAAEFRMNMSETFKVAEKVMNPESAIELTANMQMLGGAIGDLNDPLKLMYMATNNVEGLQDAIQGAASTLATYNKEQGRFEITGANLRRAKEMATQLGVSYSEFSKGAIAAQERIAANDALLAKGFNIKDKDREFLTNMSQMKDGKMTITIPQSLMSTLGKEIGGQSEIALDNLTQEQVTTLEKYRQQIEDLNPQDLAKAQFTTTKNIDLNMQSAAMSLRILAKNRTLGRNEDLKANNGLNYENAQSGRLPYLQNLANRQIADNSITNSPVIDSALDSLGNVTKGLVTQLSKMNDVLKNTFGDFTNTKEMNQREERNKRLDEKSNPKTNEFVLKSQINVVYNGFGLPTTELKGSFLTGAGQTSRNGQ
jgi:hypothetical protein